MTAVKPDAQSAGDAAGGRPAHGPAETYDALVAGGGPVGLATALALAEALGPSARIALVDPAAATGGTSAAPRPADARALAVSAASRRLLDALGVWPALGPHAQPVEAVDITDSALSDVFRPILVSYDNAVADGEPATFILENDRLQAALLEAVARRPAIHPVAGAVAGSEPDGARRLVHLADGRSLRAALVAAADGRASPLREAAGIGLVRWQYGQVGIVTVVTHEKPHRARAVQHFLPAGPFAILPLPPDAQGAHRSCITWTEEEAWGRALVQLDDAAFLEEVEQRFRYRLGQIGLAGARAAWPLEMHLARTFVADRLALVGDAAHLVHPIAGQGLNLGFRDVAALAEVVADAARLGFDIGDGLILERYERWRRTDSAMSAAVFDTLNRLFSNDWALLRTVRDAGLGLVDRMPGLKQLLVSEAAGLTGEVPRLLRGQPL